MSITAEDRMAMIDLMGRYNQALDRRDGAAWAGTFTEDGVMEGEDDVAGRSALCAFVDALGPPDLNRHWAMNFVFETHDGITMLADMAVLKGNTVVSSGRYVNIMRRVDGAWKIARQRRL